MNQEFFFRMHYLIGLAAEISRPGNSQEIALFFPVRYLWGNKKKQDVYFKDFKVQRILMGSKVVFGKTFTQQQF